MKRGFTLLELIVVIIIIGVLATLGVTQYTKTIEKGRTAEARTVLGTIRTVQEAYKLENGSYATSLSLLPVEAPSACAGQATHYYSYSADGTKATAIRCTADGKSPAFSIAYTIELTYSTGVWSGTDGYY